jgi:magnesium-transporting ATPase (P-type)
LSFF